MSVNKLKVPTTAMSEMLGSEVINCDYLTAGMDPRCKAPPKPPPKSSGSETKPEGHEFTQHFKYRHVDKDACGTYDIIELDTAENLTKMLAPGANGGNHLQTSNNNGGGGGFNNDLDYVVHLKYRNVDKSCCGEFDIQEGEHIDVKKIILPGQCMRGGMDKPPALESRCAGQKKDDYTKRLTSGMDNEWKYNSVYSSDVGYESDKLSIDFPLLYSGLDSWSEIDLGTSKCSNIYRLRGGMDQSNEGINIHVSNMVNVLLKDKNETNEKATTIKFADSVWI